MYMQRKFKKMKFQKKWPLDLVNMFLVSKSALKVSKIAQNVW